MRFIRVLPHETCELTLHFESTATAHYAAAVLFALPVCQMKSMLRTANRYLLQIIFVVHTKALTRPLDGGRTVTILPYPDNTVVALSCPYCCKPPILIAAWGLY